MSSAPRIKICGITNLADAELSVELGAWAVGCIMWEGSARRCEEVHARTIAGRLHRDVEICGVYVNPALDEVAGQVDALGFTMVQLHGDEGPSFCDELHRRTGAKVIKAMQVVSGEQFNDLERFHHVDYHLLDTADPDLRGGTGESWDWSLAAARHSKIPLILSGGLDAANVAEAIGVVAPFAVDTATGTEASPGKKDAAKMLAFVEAVASTAPAISPELSA